MYGQHRMSPRGALSNEHLPTKVFFSGSWLNVPFNPGLYVRNRYGKEVYKHAEHWLSTGKQSGWDVYETGVFSSCPVKRFHVCVDQYQPDGSIQFENNFLTSYIIRYVLNITARNPVLLCSITTFRFDSLLGSVWGKCYK